MATLTPTRQQQDVLDAVRGYFDQKLSPAGYHKIFSLFLSAVAGAGKTSTIMMIADTVNSVEKEYGIQVEWTALSFNRAIKNASNKKLKERGSREVALTTNQLGRSILAEASKVGQCRQPGKMNKYKYQDLITEYLSRRDVARKIPQLLYTDPRRETEKSLTSKIAKLVSAARLTYCDCESEEALAEIVEHYGMDIDVRGPYWPFIWSSVCPVIQLGKERYQATGEHDFDDQLYLPLALDVAAPIFDLICVDEAQDLNKVRTELVKRSIKPNGALFFVGDRRQAIQGFAFADTNSVENIIRDTEARELPLTCCWRCDENIIRLAQVINPAIEARPGAEAGNVEVISGVYIDQLEAGYWTIDPAGRKDADMILCRVTAPLVKDCLTAIRQGVLAIVRGRSIGDNIVKLMNKIVEKNASAYNVQNMSAAANDYFYNESARIHNSGRRDADEEVDKLLDQIDTLEALVEGFLLTGPEDTSVVALKAFIESKFEGEEGDQDEDGNPKEGPRPVVFSTVHKAKGLETDRVFIIEPSKMPHPMAMKSGKAWQKEQEYNILYVAITRPRHSLFFVGSVPASLVAEYNAITAPEELDAEEVVAAAVEIFSQPVEVSIQGTDISFKVEASISPVEAQQTAPEMQEANIPAPATKRPYGGRKALDQSDKRVFFQQTWDPSIRAAFKGYVENYNAEHESNLSEADMLEQIVLSNPGFAAFFQTSPASVEYTERQERAEQRRIAYKNRNKRQVAPAPEPDDDDSGPEDDGPGGGEIPAPEAPSDMEYLPDVRMFAFRPELIKPAEPVETAPVDDYTARLQPGDLATSYMGNDIYQKSTWNGLTWTDPEEYRYRPTSGDLNARYMFSLEDTAYWRPSPVTTLFPDMPAAPARRVRRVAYSCLSKHCNRAWLVDYYTTPSGVLYRIQDGRTVYASEDFPACPYCNNARKFIKVSYPKASYSGSRKCDSRCRNARPGSPCSCQCGGSNHGLGENGANLIGPSLLQPASEEVED